MRRDHDANTIRQNCRLVGARRGLALHDRLGLDDLERHALGQGNGDRAAVEHQQVTLHVLVEIVGVVSEHGGRHSDLLVVFGVHEDVVGVVLEQVGVHHLLDKGALQLVGCLVRLHDFHAVRNAAHLDRGGGRALARAIGFGLEHRVELAILVL